MSETGSSPLGFVESVSGSAASVCVHDNLEVEEFPLKIHDPIYPGELIQTGPDGSVVIRLQNGGVINIGPLAELEMDPETVVHVAEEAPPPAAPAEPLDDVDAIQQALLAGADPTQELEATAAGPGGGGGAGDEGNSFVILERSGQRTTPQAGWDSDQAPPPPFPQPEEEDLFAEDLPAPLADPPILTLLNQGNLSTVEGDPGDTPATITFVITRTGVLDLPTTVDYQVVPDDAMTPEDFYGDPDALSGSVEFAPGETQKTVTVSVTPDLLAEFDESFHIELSNPVNAILQADDGPATILNDDFVVFSISGPSAVDEGDEAVYTVRLEGELGDGITTSVKIQTADGMPPVAVSGADYDPVTQTLVFSTAPATATITVQTSPDDLVEGLEFFRVTLAEAGTLASVDPDNGFIETAIVDADTVTFRIDPATDHSL